MTAGRPGFRPRNLSSLRVFASVHDRRKGFLVAGNAVFPCALGRSGIRTDKREGDGGTPIGTFRMVGAFYRADRLPRPDTALPLRAIRETDGWCDDPESRFYNQWVESCDLGLADR